MIHDTPSHTPRKSEKQTAWRRFRRLLGLTAFAAVLAIAGAIAWLGAVGTELSVHVVIATALGVGLSVLLGGLLMALVFLSSNLGTDTGPEIRRGNQQEETE